MVDGPRVSGSQRCLNVSDVKYLRVVKRACIGSSLGSFKGVYREYIGVIWVLGNQMANGRGMVSGFAQNRGSLRTDPFWVRL